VFLANKKQSFLGSMFATLELIYHSTVRHVRKSSRNALMGLIANFFQSVVMLGAFFFFMTMTGMRDTGGVVRGDFVIFLLTGIFLFMTHNKALKAVSGAESSTSAMMLHAPMNTIVSIAAAALGTLYNQVLSVALLLFIVHVAWRPVEVYNPAGLVVPFTLAWFSGVCIGLLFLACSPWAPGFFAVLSAVYQRANMIASGKMFLANAMGSKIIFFSWNPLFHTIDQARGAAFINYNPRFTSIEYPLYLCLVLLVLGMMLEFYTRRHASVSWSSAR
jgi:ABC-type polysaccharide/polyol phosphate export permease